MEKLETKEGSYNEKDDSEQEVGLAREFGNLTGRAEVLEAFYCHPEEEGSRDFGLGNSVRSIPSFPIDLGLYSEKTFQVIHIFSSQSVPGMMYFLGKQ